MLEPGRFFEGRSREVPIVPLDFELDGTNEVQLTGLVRAGLHNLLGRQAPIRDQVLLEGFDGGPDVRAAIEIPKRQILAFTLGQWDETFALRSDLTAGQSPVTYTLYAQQPSIAAYDAGSLKPVEVLPLPPEPTEDDSWLKRLSAQMKRSREDTKIPTYTPRRGRNAREAMLAVFTFRTGLQSY